MDARSLLQRIALLPLVFVREIGVGAEVLCAFLSGLPGQDQHIATLLCNGLSLVLYCHARGHRVLRMKTSSLVSWMMQASSSL